ncbi:MAG: hypothetical protein E7425_11550 [Ruminococcaceae bacterium]|jgi:hypothetical protein|nr:hypothetical protein [Oscillospiraceae bacterium]
MPRVDSVDSARAVGGLSGAWRQVYYASRVSAAYAAAANPSRPNTPVEPVSPVRPVAKNAPVRVPIAVPEPPAEDELDSASERLARMRVLSPEDVKKLELGFNSFLKNDSRIS